MKQSKHNIYYSPKEVRTILERSIDTALDGLKCYCNDPVSDFTRCRKLPARTLIECIMSFSNYSSIGEMSHFFEGHGKMPSASALSQRRQLLDPDIFKRINNLFVSAFDDHTTINGYHILAQDGSDVNIPFMDDKTKTEKHDAKSFCQYHVNALYDCLNKVFYDWSIDAASKKREVNALISILKDRGYESYNLMAHFIENDIKFVIRVKDIHTKSGLMTNIKTEEGAFDMRVNRTLTSLQTKEIKADKEKYIFVPSTSNFDFLDENRDFYDLSFRAVRFKISEDVYETVVTNLSEEEFKAEDFKELYHYRWNEETAFNKLKYTIGLVYFHARKRKLIQQEINAAFLMYNVSEVVIRNIDLKKNKKPELEYDYKPNFSSAVTNIRLYLRKQISVKQKSIKTYKKRQT
ncbi:IS4 family transposase [uncultured Catenibacterium sp.]|uniref:IS4 family transposase n=1 Tax=uncultured Catenibacterium sp. TaxID=286142 RepID=UPI0025DDD9C1|nr:IS4 family transposase [uncultured Catenibacterium sp.]